MMLRSLCRAGALAASAAVGACQAGSVLPQPLAVAVDSATYHRHGESSVAVPFTIANAGPQSLYVWQCDGSPEALIDRLSLGTWRFLEGGFCNGQASRLAIAPGDSVRGTVTLLSSGKIGRAHV